MSGSFVSVCWNACVHRLDLGLYSHLKEFLESTHVNSKGKIHSTGKIFFRGGSNPQHCIKQDSKPNTLPTSYSAPPSRPPPAKRYQQSAPWCCSTSHLFLFFTAGPSRFFLLACGRFLLPGNISVEEQLNAFSLHDSDEALLVLNASSKACQCFGGRGCCLFFVFVFFWGGGVNM